MLFDGKKMGKLLTRSRTRSGGGEEARRLAQEKELRELRAGEAARTGIMPAEAPA